MNQLNKYSDRNAGQYQEGRYCLPASDGYSSWHPLILLVPCPSDACISSSGTIFLLKPDREGEVETKG